MVTSFPTRRLGIAIGMRAPCKRPRLNPAGRARCSSEAESRLSVQPTAVASSTTASSRSGTFHRLLPELLGQPACRSLSILDLGAGDGSLGKVLAPWAAKRGWNWRFTNLDIHFLALSLNHTGVNVVASALALPFRDASFDVV